MRTEEQKLAKAPIKVKLGDLDFEIKVLAAGATYKWRETLATEYTQLFQQLTPADFSGLRDAMTQTLLKFPNKLADFIFSYSPELTDRKEWVMENATDEQLRIAYASIMEVAFPYLAELGAARAVFAKN